ncbi:MAG: alpha/beta fold hydrolase [Aggregatilineales bacterium]
MFDDNSPHQTAFVKANGVTLHYLDWGGTGETLLFLPGLGNSVHVFDDMAPEFTRHFRVLGLTRRGQGQSEAPETGYDTATLSEDIHQFLGQLHIERVSLIGHSLAGAEMTYFAGRYPQYVDRLIYFDANYDAADVSALTNALPISYPSSEHHRQSVSTYRPWLQKNMYGGSWSNALEADLRDTLKIAEDGTFSDRMPDYVGAALVKGMIPRPDYASIQAPALAFFAIKDHFPGIEDHDEATREKVRIWINDVAVPWIRKAAERLQERFPQARIIEITGTHYFFIDKQAEVVQDMNRFLNIS